MHVAIAAGLALLLTAVWTNEARGQRRNPIPGASPLTIESMSGRDSFEFYCAPCHGRDGRGKGPVAEALKTAPTDLTLLARRAGGVYSRVEVIAYVTGTGRVVPAHGGGAMPVWGPIFRSLDPSDARVKVRIENLVGYLESIQAR